MQSAVTAACARALEIVGGMAETDVKAVTPVDTGNLRNSISHRTDGSTEVEIGTSVEYAPYVELGARGRDGRHYLRDGIMNNTDKYRRVIEQELRNLEA